MPDETAIARALRTVAHRREGDQDVLPVEGRLGPIDLMVSNAGIGTGAGVEASDEAWQRILGVNVLAHVHAADAVLPSMLARGEGYLLSTASAAGLLTQIGDLPYSVTKHAAVAVADAIDWCRDRGLVAAQPMRDVVAAVSVGIVDGEALLDLDYAEDSRCDTDMNVVMTGAGGFVEVQGTAERAPFSRAELDALIALAARGLTEIAGAQRRARP